MQPGWHHDQAESRLPLHNTFKLSDGLHWLSCVGMVAVHKEDAMAQSQSSDAMIRAAEWIVRQRLGAEYGPRSMEVLTLLREIELDALDQKIWHDAAMLADVAMDRLPEKPAPLSLFERLARAVAPPPPPPPPPNTVTVAFTIDEWNAAVDGLELALARASDRKLALLLSRTIETLQLGHIASAQGIAA